MNTDNGFSKHVDNGKDPEKKIPTVFASWTANVEALWGGKGNKVNKSDLPIT